MSFRVCFWFIILLALGSCKGDEELGTELFEAEKYEEALVHFEKALRMNKNDWRLIYNIGRCHEELKDHKKAIRFYSQSLDIWVSTEARLGRARCYYAIEDDDSAVLEATNVLKVDTKNFEALYVRGKSYLRQVRYYRARNDFNQALSINNEHVNSHYHRAIARSQINDNRGALSDMNYFVERKDNFNQAYFNRGIIYQRMGRYTKAKKDYDKAIKLNLRTGDVFLRRGRCNYELGKKELACQDFKHAGKYDEDTSSRALNQFCN